jgi:hypothetical protein
MGAGAVGRLSDPLVDSNVDGVPRLRRAVSGPAIHPVQAISSSLAAQSLPSELGPANKKPRAPDLVRSAGDRDAVRGARRLSSKRECGLA